jgi:hypothetical protein
MLPVSISRSHLNWSFCHFICQGETLAVVQEASAHRGQAMGCNTRQDGRGCADQGRPLRLLGVAGVRTEMPGCSLFMGNRAQVRESATVVSTSKRNLPNCFCKSINVLWPVPLWPPLLSSRATSPGWLSNMKPRASRAKTTQHSTGI